jgi:shikimate kinase
MRHFPLSMTSNVPSEKRHLVLIGMMGSGKSSVGRTLAVRSKAPFVDTDAMIEGHCRKRISELFQELGEARFRTLEQDIVCQAAEDETPCILSTGGGAIVTPANREALWRTGFVVYLHAPPEVLYERLKRDTSRPLLRQPDPLGTLRQLWTARRAYYEAADLILDVSQIRIRAAADALWNSLPDWLIRRLQREDA